MPDTFQLGGYDAVGVPYQPFSVDEIADKRLKQQQATENVRIRRQAALDQHLKAYNPDPVSQLWGQAEFRLQEQEQEQTKQQEVEKSVADQYDDPVAKVWAIAQHRMQNQGPMAQGALKAQKRQAAVEQMQRQDRMSAALDQITPDNAFVRESVGGALNAAPDFVALAARLTGSGEAADELNRQSQEMQQARGQMREEDWSPWLSGMYGGVVQNIAQMAGTPGGAYSKIAGAALQAGNQALTTAEDAGLKGNARLRYAGTQALFEGGIAAIFQKAFPGLGAESRVAGQGVAAQTWKQLAKQIGKDALAEMPEEAVTSILQDVSSKLEGVSPDMEIGDFAKNAAEAAVQAAMMSGIANTPNAARMAVSKFVAQPSRKNYEALPDELKQGPANQAQRQALAEQLQQQGTTVPESNVGNNNTPAVSPEEQAAIDDNNRITALKSPGAQPDFVPPTEAQTTVPSSSSGEEVIPSAVQGQPEAAPTSPPLDLSQMSEDELNSYINGLLDVPAAQATVPENTEVTNEQVPVQQEEQGRQGRERLLDRTAARNQQRSWTQTVPDSLPPTTLPPVRNASDFDHAAEIAKRKESEATPGLKIEPSNQGVDAPATAVTDEQPLRDSAPTNHVAPPVKLQGFARIAINNGWDTERVRKNAPDAGIDPDEAVSAVAAAVASGVKKPPPPSYKEEVHPEDIAFESVHNEMAKRGGVLKNQSDSGSRYYQMPNGQHVRVSDHAPNEATERWIDNNSVDQVRVDSKDWRRQLDSAMEFHPNNPEPSPAASLPTGPAGETGSSPATSPGTEPPRSESEPTLPESSPAPARPDAGVASVPPEQGRKDVTQNPFGRRSNPPQVSSPTVIEASIPIESGGVVVNGKGVAFPGFEDQVFVLTSPRGSKAKATKQGYAVWHAGTGAKFAESMDIVGKKTSPAEAISLAADRLKAMGRSMFNERFATAPARPDAGVATVPPEQGSDPAPLTGIEKARNTKRTKDMAAAREQFAPLVSEGWTPGTAEVEDVPAQKKLESERKQLANTAPIGNENHPETKRLRELTEQLKNPVTKPVYFMASPDGRRRKSLTKTQYEAMTQGQDSPAPTNPDVPPAQGQTAEAPKLEPWQMTREDWVEHRLDNMTESEGRSYKTSSGKWHNGRDQVRNQAEGEWFAKNEEAAAAGKPVVVKPSWMLTQAEEDGQYGNGVEEHRMDVERAVKLGFPVPAKVLAEYPDLQKKAQGQTAEAAPVPESVPPENAPATGISENLRKSIDESLKTMSPDEIISMLTKRAKFSPSANESLEGVKAYLADKQGPIPAKAEVAQGPKKEPWQTKLEEVKQQYPGSIVVIRHEDGYKLLGDDAKVASKVLGLSLTVSGAGPDNKNAIVTAGFPYYSLEGYLRKLINAGHRVAVAEDPTGKKDAKRNITVAEPSAAGTEPTSYQRTTPVPGSPERLEIEARVKTLDESIQKMDDEYEDLDKKYQKAGYGTKLKESLSKRLDKLREKISKHKADNDYDGLREKKRLMWLEDVATQSQVKSEGSTSTGKDEANAIAARHKILSDVNTDSSRGEQKRLREQINEMALKEAKGQSLTGEDAKKAARSASLYIMDFPGSRSLSEMISGEVRSLEATKSHEGASKAIEALPHLDSYRKKHYREQLNKYNAGTNERVVQQATQENKDKAAAAKTANGIKEAADLEEFRKAWSDTVPNRTNVADMLSKEGYINSKVGDKPAISNARWVILSDALPKTLKTRAETVGVMARYSGRVQNVGEMFEAASKGAVPLTLVGHEKLSDKPKSKGKNTTLFMIGKAVLTDGEYTIDVDEGYYNYLSKNGFEFRGRPSVVKKTPMWGAEAALTLYKDGELAGIIMPIGQDHSDKNETLESLKQKIEQARAAAPKDTIADKAEAARQEFSEAVDKLAKLSGGATSPNFGSFSPEQITAFVNVTVKAIKAGALTFAEYSSMLAEAMGDMVEQYRPLMKTTWAKMAAVDKRLDPSTEFDEGASRRDTEPEEPGNDYGPDQPTLFEEPPKNPEEPGNGATPEGSIPDPLATKHADSDATREAMDLPHRTLAGDHTEHKWKRLAERANAADKGEIDGLIADLVEIPRILTDYEDALISRRQTEVINAYEESQRRLAEASADGNAAQVVAFQNESRARAAEEAILLGILDPGGTAAGRALAHRKAAIQRDYSVARMIMNYRAEHANAEPSQADLDRWAEMEAKVIEAVDRAEKSDAAREAAEQALAIEKVHDAAVAEVETEKKTKTVTDVVKTGIEKARKRIENGFKMLGAMKGKVYSIETAAGDLTLALTEIARGYTELGVFSFVDAMKRFTKRVGDEAESMRGDFKKVWDQHIAENGVGDIRDQIDPENPSSIGTVAKRLHQFVIERDGLGKSAEDRGKAVAGVHELLHEAMPELTLEQTGRILSGKDEPTRRLSEEEIRAEHRAQLQILEDIKSWRNNQRPNAIQESRPSSEEQRKLRRIKAEARKNAKIEETEADEKTQLKSALDSAKIAMRNRIDDLSEAVRKREPIVHSKTAQRTDSQLDDLRKERDEWKKKYDEIFGKKELSDEQRAAALERALDRQIAQLEDDIPKGILYPPPKQPKLPISNPAIALKMARRDELVARRNELRVMSGEQEQRQMAAYERSLAARLRFWQERMSQGDFGPKPPKEPRKLTDKAASLQYEIEKAKEAFANEQERWRIANRTTAEKFKDFAGNAWDFRRDIVSTGEMSPFGRQGMMYVSGHWMRAANAIAQSVSVLFQRNANEALSKINQSILDRPNAKAGFYKDIPFATKLNQRTAQEEIMIGEWAKRIPVLGSIVKRFGASGEAFLNLARADMMDSMLSTIGAVPGKVSPAEVKVLANAAGVFTGHGNVDPGVAKVLNKVVYSSLFTMSRIELAVGRPLWSGTAKTRLAIGREYIQSAAGLYLLSQMMRFALAALGDDDEEVTQELDTRSSDFGKLKSKGTRIDMLGGESQILVLLTRLLSHEKAQDGVVSSLGSTFGGTDEAKLILNFVRSRLHPTMSSLLNRFIFKEDVIGERPRELSEYDPTTTEGLQNIATENSPMAYADMVEAVQELGYPQGLVAATAAFFGAGLNTYGGSEQDSLKSIALKAAGAMSYEDRTKATSGVMKGYTTPEFLRVGVDQAKKALRDARTPQARRDAENALRKAQDAVDAAKGGDVTVESARDQLRKRFKTREDMVRSFREAYKEKHGNAASDGFFDALDRLPKFPGSISPSQKQEMLRDLDEMTLREQQADYVRRHPGRTPPSTVRKYERRDDGTLDFNRPLKGYKTLRRRIESL
jgi:hypothetical protein